MKLKEGHIKVALELISFLFILLFVYAAVSKLLDYGNFRVQLGQSPLLTAFADWVSWAVPLSEIVIAGMLFVPRLRLWGLYAAYSLMVMFTAYIVIILNFTDFIPCSCGGVLEKLGWTEHLVFDLFFVLLAAVGVLLLKMRERDQVMQYGLDRDFLVRKPFVRNMVVTMGLLIMASVSLLMVLFLISEEQFHNNNSFVRRFPGKPAQKLDQLDLGLNSYYIAGAGNGKIYLGNTTAPLHVLVLDTLLQNKKTVQIELDLDSVQSRSTQLKVLPPYFFLLDGTVPFVFKGRIDRWKGHKVMGKGFFFSMVQPIDSVRLAIRTVSSQTFDHVLGKVSLMDNNKVTLSHTLLQKQVDGIFDTDGILQYNSQLKRLVYTYYYRNEFILANEDLELEYRGRTIDTVSMAKIEVASIRAKNQRKLAAPPLLVNKYAATHGNYLFVNSKLPGKYGTWETWSKNSIIDVYDIVGNTYEFSFKINDVDGEKLKMFHVLGNRFIGLIGNHIVTYRLHSYAFRN